MIGAMESDMTRGNPIMKRILMERFPYGKRTYVESFLLPCLIGRGTNLKDFPVGSAQVDMDLCTQCNKCSLICPHAAVGWLQIGSLSELAVFKGFTGCSWKEHSIPLFPDFGVDEHPFS